MSRFPESFNLANYFLYDRLAEGKGEKVAVRFGERAYTYRAVAERSLALAGALRDADVQAEDRVLIVLPDTPAFVWSIFATWTAGAVVTMGNPIAPAADLAYALEYTRATALITTPQVAGSLATEISESTQLVQVLLAPHAATDEDPEGALAETFGHEALADACRGEAAEIYPTKRDDVACWLFTSGSTGRAKAAVHCHRDFAFNTEVYAKGTVGYTEDDVTLSVPRLFFGYATGTNLFFPFAVGATTALFSERPTPQTLIAAIERYRPTVVTNVPTMLGKILEHDQAEQGAGRPGLDMSCVRFHLSAGEALPPALLKRFTERFGAEVYDGIGSAEMFHIYASNRPGDVVAGSLGRVVEGYEIRILPRDAEGPGAPEVAVDEVGVMWVKGDSVAQCYFQDRDKSFETFHGHWCRTGDLFRRDGHGYLWFSGRADDLFKVSGIWVAPLELEDCLTSFEAVSMAAVVPIEVDGLTKAKAFVVLREGSAHLAADERARETLSAELKAHCQTKLSKHKYPREFSFVEDLPKNDRGKVDKKALRAGELSR